MGSALRPPGSAAWGSRFVGVHGVAVPEVGLLCVLVARARPTTSSRWPAGCSAVTAQRTTRRPRRAATEVGVNWLRKPERRSPAGEARARLDPPREAWRLLFSHVRPHRLAILLWHVSARAVWRS
jgi:hypothetical protein